MKLLENFFILLSACWGLSLRLKLFSYTEPLVTPINKVELGITIPNLWSSLLQANIYTMTATWALSSRTRKVQKGNRLVRYNFHWMYAMPFVMHCISSYYTQVSYILATLGTPAVLQSTNFGGVVLKLYWILFLHLFFLIEMALIVFNRWLGLYQSGATIF